MATNKSQPEILLELLDAITRASGYSWQLTHALQDPRWMPIRDSLDLMKEMVTSLAPRGLTMKPVESTKSIII